MPEDSPAPGSGLLDKLAASAKKAVGRVVKNDDLVEEGALQAQKADVALETARLEAEAEQAERRADLAAEKAQNRVDQARVQAELDERARTEQIERDEQAAKNKVAELEARQQQVVVEKELTKQTALEGQLMDAAVERVHGVREAAEIDAEARHAEKVADVLDAARANLDQQTTGG